MKRNENALKRSRKGYKNYFVKPVLKVETNATCTYWNKVNAFGCIMKWFPKETKTNNQGTNAFGHQNQGMMSGSLKRMKDKLNTQIFASLLNA